MCNMKFAATCTLRASEAWLYIHAHLYHVWRVLCLLPATYLMHPIEMTSAENMIHLWYIFADVFPYVRSVINGCFVERDRHVKYSALSVLATTISLRTDIFKATTGLTLWSGRFAVVLLYVAVYCSILQHIAAYCNVLGYLVWCENTSVPAECDWFGGVVIAQ